MQRTGDEQTLRSLLPAVSSENRSIFLSDLLQRRTVISAIWPSHSTTRHSGTWRSSPRACIWSGSPPSAASWKRDSRYSNTLGWNTFPVPTLTEKNKADLTRCAEDILLAREAHFPATIADLYDPDNMPADLRAGA